MSQSLTLKIDGMSCQMCVKHVRHALSSLDGVEIEDVQVGSARVSLSNGDTTPDQVLEAVREAGYEASLAG